MKQHICVYDFETDSSDPKTCEPVQLAACILNKMTLQVMDGSEFCTDMRPSDIDEENYYKEHEETIKWHAGNYGCAPEEIFNKWKEATNQKEAWKLFVNHLLKYNTNQSKKTWWTAPIRGGCNIREFDNIIIQRLSEKYGNVSTSGETNLFYPRDVIDIKEVAFYWFESCEEPKAYNMDTLRPFFNIPGEQAHDAMKDIQDEAWMIARFIGLFRNQTRKIKFKGAYKNVQKTD